MKIQLSLVAAIVFLASATPAFAAAGEGIAAIVNDSIVTISDIRDRTDLYISGAHGNVTPDQRKKMEQQVLSKLIDESLELQEAKKLGITVDDRALASGFEDISRQNGIAPDEFRKRLKAAGVNVDSLKDQIRAEIAWAQVIRRKLRPQINVSESEIDMTMDQLAHGSSKAQYHVAEIFLNVPDPAREQDVRAEAEKMVGQLTSGASFSTIAREFSQSPGAASGGDLGWVQAGQLEPDLDKALGKMQPGQVSPPVRSSRGYHILFLRDIHQSASPTTEKSTADGGPMVTLKQIIIPVSAKDPTAVINAKRARGEALKGELKSCDDMNKKMKDFPAQGTGDLGKGPQNSLPAQLRAIIEKLPENTLSAPVHNPAGWAMIMVCKREEPTATAAALPKFSGDKSDENSREDVANKIGAQRLDKMAERYLRDLRATAFIDKRI
jgi:peptidyl-prolyl cis-trans isomerase SurA